MTTITLELPEEVAAKAKAMGNAAIAELIRAAGQPLPPGYDPRLLNKIPPELFGSVVIHDDSLDPIDVEWEAAR